MHVDFVEVFIANLSVAMSFPPAVNKDCICSRKLLPTFCTFLKRNAVQFSGFPAPRMGAPGLVGLRPQPDSPGEFRTSLASSSRLLTDIERVPHLAIAGLNHIYIIQ